MNGTMHYHVFYDQWHERDVANFVRRDRNHPSAIAWSSGNEVPEQKNKDFWWGSENLTKLFRSHDPTRKITVGINHLSSAASPFADTVDITGLNYPVKDKNIIAKVRAWRKDVPIMTLESSSCVSSRGCYFFPLKWYKGSGFRGYVTITIADDKKRLVPGSMDRLKFKVSGSAEIAGICNGDPTSLESMQGDTLPAFNGLCQVVLRSKAGSPGLATLSVEAEGMPAAGITITTK